MKKLRICMLVMNNVSPDIRVEKEAKTLMENGHRVEIIGLTDGEHELAERVMFQFNDIIIHRILIEETGIKKYFAYWKGVKKFFKNEKFDVIHYHDLNVLPLVGVLKRKAKYHIYDSHELFPEMMRMKYGWIGFRVFSRLENIFVKRIDTIITPGNACVDALKKKYPRKDIKSVPNYPEIIEKNKSTKAKKQKGFHLVVWGNIYFERGYEQIVRALGMIKETGKMPKDLRLHIIGTGPAERRIRAFVDYYDLNEIVEWYGWTKRIKAIEIISTCHVGLCMVQGGDIYLESANPNRLFDYMLSAIPAIVSDIKGHRNLFEEEDDFIHFVKPDDKLELANMIWTVYNYSKTKQKELKMKSYRAHLKRFNWTKVEVKLLEVYKIEK